MKQIISWFLSLILIFTSTAAIAETDIPEALPTLGISDMTFLLNLQNNLYSTYGYGVISSDGLEVNDDYINWQVSPATSVYANVENGEIQHIRVFGGKDLNNSFELIMISSCVIASIYDGAITLDRACAVMLQALNKEAFIVDDMRFRMGSSDVNLNYELLIVPEALFEDKEQTEGDEQ